MNQTNELSPGITAEEIARHHQRKAALKEAALAALPGPVRDAFVGESPVVHGFTLQPITAGLIARLTRIDSPFLDIVKCVRLNAGKTNEEREAALAAMVKPDPDAMIETVYLFVTPGAKIRELLRRGRAVLLETAHAELGDKLGPVEMSELETACGAHFALAFSTVVEYAAPQEKGQPVFPSPPTTAPATASAGGSTL